MSNVNWWFVLAPLFLVASALVGIASVARVACKVFHRWNDHDRVVAHAVSAAATTTVGVMVLRESWRGLLQLGLNCLTVSDSRFWGALMAGSFFMGAAVVYYGICFVAYLMGKMIRERCARIEATRQRKHCQSVGGRGVYCPFADSDEISCSVMSPVMVRKQASTTQSSSERFVITSFLPPANVSSRR